MYFYLWETREFTKLPSTDPRKDSNDDIYIYIYIAFVCVCVYSRLSAVRTIRHGWSELPGNPDN